MDSGQDRLLELAASVIRANEDLGGIVATWSLAVNAPAEAVAQSGRDVPIAGYDSEAPGYMELYSGGTNIVAFSGQQAAVQARAAIDGLAQAMLGAKLCEETVTPDLLVTAENHAGMWET